MKMVLSAGTVLLVSGLSLNVFAEESADADWQLKRLNSPTAHQLTQERDKVYIYDGLYSHQVDEAMNNQFERIDHMMFVRTKVVSDGVEQTLDDDCD